MFKTTYISLTIVNGTEKCSSVTIALPFLKGLLMALILAVIKGLLEFPHI